jgi:hypothetical protein
MFRMTRVKWSLVGLGALIVVALAAAWGVRHYRDGAPTVDFSAADLEKGGPARPGEHDALISACQARFRERLGENAPGVCDCLAAQAEQNMARPWRLMLTAKFSNDVKQSMAVSKGVAAAGLNTEAADAAERDALTEIAAIIAQCVKAKRTPEL